MTKEQKIFKALQDVFIGAQIEGEGGFVNLMRIKSNYYQKIEEILKKDIEEALKNHPKFRDELFDKLYSFFSRYFTESGSIYFNSTPFHNNIYEKVYTDEKDVILFWKTQMLYYVKTDRIFRSLPVEFDGFKFYFDASKIESKKANEKRSLIFELNKVREDDTIVFGVSYSERGTKENELIFDFFLGSGTTIAVAHKLGRRWVGVEMGEHFYSVVLPRMKKVLAYDKGGISKDVKEYKGGGFFKYYELEQYEEALANCKHKDSDLFNSPSKTPYQEYVFIKDEKMLKALEIDHKNNKVKVDLTILYPDIDIAETLSNLTGKWIKKITNDELEFTDGTKINTKDLDYKLIKPLIWW